MRYVRFMLMALLFSVEDLSLMNSNVRDTIIPSLAKRLQQRASDNTLVSALKSSVVITSNFGHMDRTRGWTRARVRHEVQDMSLTLFSPMLLENVVVVPLVAYEEDDFRAIAHQMMQNEFCAASYANFECLIYPKALVDEIASAAFRDKYERSKNARGVWERLDREVLWLARYRSTEAIDRPSAGWFGDPNVYDLVFHSEKYPLKNAPNGPDLRVSPVSRPKGSSPSDSQRAGDDL